MKNIYVGNLDVSTTEEQLRNVFQPFGPVETVTLVIDRDTGSARGFAFIEMPNDAEADKAINTLNGSVLRDRTLVINEARSKNEGDVAERRKQPRQSLATRDHRRHRY
jgi:RNA recognition motif-containing protein